MNKFTVTSWRFNPINLICIIMLSTLLVMQLAGKPATTTPTVSHDTTCPYEYGECPNPHCSNYSEETVPKGDYRLPRDYQLEILDNQQEQKIIVYDGNRIVGTYPFTWNTMLGKMIMIDNN